MPTRSHPWKFWYNARMKDQILDLIENSPLHSTDGIAEGQKRVLFQAWTPKMPGWRWTAYEGEMVEMDEVLFFGRVDGWESELGYFSLSDLESVDARIVVPIDEEQPMSPEQYVEQVESLAEAGYYD